MPDWWQHCHYWQHCCIKCEKLEWISWSRVNNILHLHHRLTNPRLIRLSITYWLGLCGLNNDLLLNQQDLMVKTYNFTEQSDDLYFQFKITIGNNLVLVINLIGWPFLITGNNRKIGVNIVALVHKFSTLSLKCWNVNFSIYASKGPVITMHQLNSIYNSPFKDSRSHPIHTCFPIIASNGGNWQLSLNFSSRAIFCLLWTKSM